LRILVVEDDAETAAYLIGGLEEEGYAVSRSSDGRDGLFLATTENFDLLIIDRMLPQLDGLSLVKSIRSSHVDTAVLFLTTMTGIDDRVDGLNAGGDDYLVKPFAFEELVARLEALLRRPGQLLGSSLRLANVVFDTESRQAFIDEKPHVLSARETAVLELLMRRKGNVVSKKLVEDQIFGLAGDVASNAVEVYVHRLRKQLADGGAKVRVNTVRGVGYIMTEDK